MSQVLENCPPLTILVHFYCQFWNWFVITVNANAENINKNLGTYSHICHWL